MRYRPWYRPPKKREPRKPEFCDPPERCPHCGKLWAWAPREDGCFVGATCPERPEPRSLLPEFLEKRARRDRP